MAQPIKKSDIVENDILQGLISEFERASIVNKQFNDGLKESAKLLKGGLNKIDFTSTESLTQANIRLKEANQLFKQKLELEKANKQNAIAEEKLRQQQIKTQEQLNRQTEREIKNQTKLQGAYSRINGWLGNLRKEYRDLAIRKEVLNNLSKDEERRMLTLEKRINRYDSALKKVDATMGNHQRNVGNYASAYNGLGMSVNQLTREMPAFANSVGTGFMAISNNLPIFFDEIQKIKKENANLAAEGKKTTSVLSQLGASIFSWGTALSIGVTLLTVYGAKLVEYISNLQGTNKEKEKAIKLEKEHREEINKERKSVSDASSEFVGYVLALKQSNKGSKERSELIKEINKQYGTTLKNISDETKFQKQLNNIINDYISYKRAEYNIKKNDEKISLNLQMQDKLEKELYENRIKLLEAENRRKILQEKAGQDTNDLLVNEASGYTQIAEKIKEQENKLVSLQKHLESYGFSILKSKELMNDLGFEAGKDLQKIIDLTREIEDEQNKRIENELKRNIIEARLNAKRRIEDLKEVKASEEQKKKLIEEINKSLYYELTKIYDEYYSKEIEAYQKNLDEKKKLQEQLIQSQEEWDKEVLSELDDYYTEQETIAIKNTKNTNEELKQIELENNIQKLKDKLSYLNTDKELHKSEIIKTENELAKLERELTEKRLQDRYKIQRQLVQMTTEYFIQQSEKRIEQLDKELAKHQSNYSMLQELAKQGNIQAKESLAVENQQIVEANKKKMEEQKRMQRIKFAESAFSAYSNNAENGVKNPLLKTITDMTLLRQFIATLPSFEKGTEDTGKNGHGVDGKGGFISILHPNERVMTKEQNAMLGGLKNDEVAEIIDMHRSGKLVQFDGANALNTNWQTSLLISEIKDLKQIIKDKPEMSIEAGKIIQGTMEIVETRKQGNTVRRNKYIV